MAKQLIQDSSLIIGGTVNSNVARDLSGVTNSVTFSQTCEEVDVTCLTDTQKRRIGALTDCSFSAQVFDDNTDLQPHNSLASMQNLVGAQYAWVESNASMAEGDRGVMVKALQSSLTKGGPVGSAATIDIAGNGDGPMILGRVLQEDSSLTVSGNSTGIQFGALAAGETLNCKLFVYVDAGGTLDCTIYSDVDSGFGTETLRATFTQVTAIGSEEQTVSGPVTDTWWRFKYTLVTGPFTVLCMIGKE